MALLYPWATKDYLLWEMSLSQVLFYLRVGVEMKYPKPPKEEGAEDIVPVDQMTSEQLRAKREELRRQFGDIGNG